MKFAYFATLFASAFALGKLLNIYFFDIQMFLARAAEIPSDSQHIPSAGKGPSSPNYTQYAEALKDAKFAAVQGKEAAAKYLEKIKDQLEEVNFKKIREEIDALYTGQAEKIKSPSKAVDDAKEQLKSFIEELNTFRKNGVDAATGLMLVLAGLFLVFRGRSAFKAFLALSGFIMGGCVGLYLGHFSTYIPALEGQKWCIWLFTVALAVGGSFFVVRVYRWSVGMISAFSGMYTAIFLMGLLPFTLEQYQKYIVLSVFAAVFLALSFKFEEAVVISSTAIMGSFTATFGADSIYHFGFRQLLQSMIEMKKNEIFIEALKHSATNVLRAVLVGAVILAGCGIFVQYHFLPRGYDRD